MKNMYVDGSPREAARGNRTEIHDPANGDLLDSVPAADAADVEAAVAAAERAFPAWKGCVANERASLLHGVATRMREHQDALIEILTLEEGKPKVENEEEVEWSANTFDYYAELGRHEVGQVLPPGAPTQFNFTLKEPYGVVACITPWNYPIMLVAWKIAPALAAGNTCVVKPSELTPLSSIYLAEHCLSHLPPGVVNVVTGTGAEAGEPLVAHPSVSAIAFTGSLETGQRIASIAAPQMKKLHFELGGKDPMVIAEDAEPEKAARALAYSALLNCGQVCTSTERVYIPKARAAEFTEALVEHVRGLRLGHGLDAGTDLQTSVRTQCTSCSSARASSSSAAPPEPDPCPLADVLRGVDRGRALPADGGVCTAGPAPSPPPALPPPPACFRPKNCRLCGYCENFKKF